MLSTPDVGGLGWNTMQIGKVNMLSKPVEFGCCLMWPRVPPHTRVLWVGERHAHKRLTHNLLESCRAEGAPFGYIQFVGCAFTEHMLQGMPVSSFFVVNPDCHPGSCCYALLPRSREFGRAANNAQPKHRDGHRSHALCVAVSETNATRGDI